LTTPGDNYDKEFKKSMFFAYALLVAAPVIYLILAYLIPIEEKVGGEMDMLFYILLIIAIVEPLVLPLIERFQVNSYRAGGTSRMSPGQLLTSMNLIKFALVESIYVYGLVVYIITGDMTKMLYFYPVGIIWSVVYWPRRRAWERLYQIIEVK